MTKKSHFGWHLFYVLAQWPIIFIGLAAHFVVSAIVTGWLVGKHIEKLVGDKIP